MPKQYHPKVYAQAVRGTGYQHTLPDGTKVERGGLEWIVDYRDASGERIRLKAHPGSLCRCPRRKQGKCEHERVAHELLAQVQVTGNARSAAGQDAGQIPKIELVAAFAGYLQDLERSPRHQPGTVINQRKSVKEFESFCLARGVDDLMRINRRLLLEFRNDLAERRIAKTGELWKRNTVNRYLRDIRALLNRVLPEGVENPARSKGRTDDLFLPVTDAKQVTVLTEKELEILLSLTERDLKALFTANAATMKDMLVVFYQCGLRLGELCNLTFAQHRNGELHIEPHDGWTPKWGIRRSIPVSPAISEILERRRAPGRKYVFTTSTGTRFQERNVTDDFSRLFRQYGIVGDTGAGVSTHSLRHTFATTCLTNGVPVTTVKDWMGHQDLETTMRYYHKIRAKSVEHMAAVRFVGGA